MKTIQPILTSIALLFAAVNISMAEQAALPAPATAAADTAKDRFVNLFMPFRTERAALSPDGKYLAYTLRENEVLSIIVIDIDHPQQAVGKIKVISDDQATPMLVIGSKEKTPGQIRWMHWVTPNRLVVETNRNFPFNLAIAGEENWYNCPGEIIAMDANGQHAQSLVTPKETSEWDANQAANKNFYPRTPHIVDFSADSPESIIIQAEGVPRQSGGNRYVDRYSLNVVTGKLSNSIHHCEPATDKTSLFDRKGNPRITVTTSTLVAFPHKFLYDPGAFKSWVSLDQVISSIPAGAFSLSPNNFFGERAVPLGFSRDGNLLYYAANIGRDTFGIYAFDFKTGKRSEFAAESPVYDLYAPAPGIYPDTGSGSQLMQDELPLIESDTEPPEPITTVSAPDSDSDKSQAVLQGEAEQATKDAADAKAAGAALSSRFEKQWRSPSLMGNIEENPLVYDRFQHDVIGFRYESRTRTVRWFNPDIQNVQDTLEKTLPGRNIEILEWDSSVQRFLIRIRSVVDSGAFYIYDRLKPRLAEYVQRAPNLSRETLHEIADFSFVDPSGRQISGVFTFPHAARSVPVPVVVFCPPQPWERVHADFQPELHALAEMGFAVIQVNTRGAWGFGIKNREAIKQGYEEGQVEDIVNTINYLARRYAINPKRVALIGKQHGGYLALRALQILPDRFRCAIALDAIIDIGGWIADARWTNTDAGPALVRSYFGDAERLKQSPLVQHPELIKKPVLLLSFRGAAGKPETSAYVYAKGFCNAVKSPETPAELFELSEDYVAGLPRAKAEAFQKIEDFLNTYIYEFKVNMGELKVIKE